MKAEVSMLNLHRPVCAAILALFLFGIAFAQGPPPGAGPPTSVNPKGEDRARPVAEGRLRSAEVDAAVESDRQKKMTAAIQYMKEDFTRIQVVRNDIARNLVARKPLDYKLITEQTEEINKRANRLNLYMTAQAPENKDETERKDEEMITALVRLCKLIDSFTENPALKNAGTLDVKRVEKAKEDKARADKDLLEIIKLSETLKKKSQELREAH